MESRKGGLFVNDLFFRGYSYETQSQVLFIFTYVDYLHSKMI